MPEASIFRARQAASSVTGTTGIDTGVASGAGIAGQAAGEAAQKVEARADAIVNQAVRGVTAGLGLAANNFGRQLNAAKAEHKRLLNQLDVSDQQAEFERASIDKLSELKNGSDPVTGLPLIDSPFVIKDLHLRFMKETQAGMGKRFDKRPEAFVAFRKSSNNTINSSAKSLDSFVDAQRTVIKFNQLEKTGTAGRERVSGMVGTLGQKLDRLGDELGVVANEASRIAPGLGTAQVENKLRPINEKIVKSAFLNMMLDAPDHVEDVPAHLAVVEDLVKNSDAQGFPMNSEDRKTLLSGIEAMGRAAERDISNKFLVVDLQVKASVSGQQQQLAANPDDAVLAEFAITNATEQVKELAENNNIIVASEDWSDTLKRTALQSNTSQIAMFRAVTTQAQGNLRFQKSEANKDRRAREKVANDNRIARERAAREELAMNKQEAGRQQGQLINELLTLGINPVKNRDRIRDKAAELKEHSVLSLAAGYATGAASNVANRTALAAVEAAADYDHASWQMKMRAYLKGQEAGNKKLSVKQAQIARAEAGNRMEAAFNELHRFNKAQAHNTSVGMNSAQLSEFSDQWTLMMGTPQGQKFFQDGSLEARVRNSIIGGVRVDE